MPPLWAHKWCRIEFFGQPCYFDNALILYHMTVSSKINEERTTGKAKTARKLSEEEFQIILGEFYDFARTKGFWPTIEEYKEYGGYYFLDPGQKRVQVDGIGDKIRRGEFNAQVLVRQKVGGVSNNRIPPFSQVLLHILINFFVLVVVLQ